MFLFSQKGDIIVQGDYNARTGDIQETVLDDDNTFLNVPEDYENDEQCLRRSQDWGTVNAKGRSLLETCTALDLRILNGRIVGHFGGVRCVRFDWKSKIWHGPRCYEDRENISPGQWFSCGQNDHPPDGIALRRPRKCERVKLARLYLAWISTFHCYSVRWNSSF